MTDDDDRPASRTGDVVRLGRRRRLAGAFALVALLAAVVGALGPADKIRTTYSWPPETLPAGQQTRVWYSPLLLVRHEPETIAVDVPCAVAQALPEADSPLTIISTARRPERIGGLAVTQSGRRLIVTVGGTVLARTGAATTDADTAGCMYRLRVDGGRWSLEGGAEGATRGGSLDAMPVVTGLFSAVDLRAGSAPSIEVTTAVHATVTTLRQGLAWTIAALGALLALTLVAFAGSRSPAIRRPAGAVRAAASRVHWADAVVAAVLAGWLVLSPVFWDDGWVVVRERAFADARGFSTFYNAFGVNLPLDYWVEWLHHWLAQSSEAVPLLRLPALLCLAAVWVVCRSTLTRLAGPVRGRGDVALWALGAAFLATALAWGLTLRPEPVTALLATGVMACAVHFRERESAAAVAVAAALIPLALTAHHTGVVALAPALAVAPELFRWARRQLRVLLTIVTASVAWLVALAFVGADLGQRVEDARMTRESGITQSWRDELGRYVLLGDFPFASPLRRGSTALIVLAVLAYFVRRRRAERAALDLPAIALAIALGLLVTTPSKLPWHLGVLIGIAALAVAAETARLREDAVRSSGWQARPFLVVGAAVVAAAWSWVPREAWNPVDLRTLGWTPGLDDLLPFSRLAIVLPLVLLAAAVLFEAARNGHGRVPGVPARVASWTAPVFAIPLIVFTVGVLAADFVRTSEWTLTRQNLDALVGNRDCGLAEDMVVPRAESLNALSIARGQRSASEPTAWVPPTPVADLPRFELSARAQESVSTPWFAVPAGRPFGLFVARSSASSERLSLEWGVPEGRRIVSRGAAPVVFAPHSIETDPWSFLASSELPPPAPRSAAVRVTLSGGDHGPGETAAVTAPVTYEGEVLARGLESEATLIHPNLLLYFPCAVQPTLDDGVVEPPRHIVWFDHPFQPHPYEPTSTFLGLQDLYNVARRPTGDSADPPEMVVVFEVDTDLAGARLAPPDRTTSVS